jgi:RNA polymerase sigma-70 factor, ECF subfamily
LHSTIEVFPTDAELVAQVLAGDRDRYAMLVERHQAMLYRHALGMCGSEDVAADLVQDALIRGFTRLASCHDPERFGAWVFRILINRSKDHLRSRANRWLPLDAELPAPSGLDHPEMVAERRELSDAVRAALSSLPESQREAFLLKHVEGRSYEEMEELLGASVSALKMRVHRARESLQELLRPLVS